MIKQKFIDVLNYLIFLDQVGIAQKAFFTIRSRLIVTYKFLKIWKTANFYKIA